MTVNNSSYMFLFMNPYYLFLVKLLKDTRITPSGFAQKYDFPSFPVIMNKLKRNSDKRIHVETLQKIELALGIVIDDSDPDNITYHKADEPLPKEPTMPAESLSDNLMRVDLVAYVHAGEEGPIFSDEVIETIWLPKYVGSGELRALKVIGDSMAPTINEGDIITVSLNSMAYDGDVALIAYNNHEYILKRVYFNDDRDIITITSDNSKYFPTILHASQIKSILPVVYRTQGRNSLRIK